VKLRRQSYFLSETLHHQVVGLEHTSEGVFNLYFGPVYVGQLSEQEKVIRRLHDRRSAHPYRCGLLPMCPV